MLLLLSECGEGELSLHIGPHFIIGLNFTESSLILTFPDEGDFPVNFFYTNIYTEKAFSENRTVNELQIFFEDISVFSR